MDGFTTITSPQQPSGKSLWIDLGVYVALALFGVVLAAYGFFFLKVYLQQQQLKSMDTIIAAYGTQEQKIAEQEFFAYKKKIDDFNSLIEKQRVVSNVFAFIESHTLPNIWLTDFNMTESKNTLRLIGLTDSIEVLSRQVQVFEMNEEVDEVSIFDSQTDAEGNTNFILNLSLNPSIFAYRPLGAATP